MLTDFFRKTVLKDHFSLWPGMKKEPPALFLNIFLGIMIYLNAEMGGLLGFKGQTLPISVVWPATGVALGALLLFGPSCWRGIFAGNFAYNFLHLFISANQPPERAFFGPLLVALIKSGAALLQAFVSYSIMQKYSTTRYFVTLKDILIFLGPVTLLSCCIASTISVTTLYLYGALGDYSFGANWLAFWVGDSMGVYLLTPLLVTWGTGFWPSYKLFSWEIVWMVALLLVLSLLTFVLDLPIALLFILFCLWVTYRFGLQGATLVIFIIAFVSIISTAKGRGSFSTYLTKSELLILVTFLDVLVANSLIFAAVRNENRSRY